MIPNTIAELADALEAIFGIDHETAIDRAWSISERLKENKVTLVDVP